MTEPATKQDLDQAMDTLRGEMSAMEARLRNDLGNEITATEDRLRGEMAAMEARLRDELKEADRRMSSMENRLLHEIGAAATRVANVMAEHHRSLIAALDDKYRDLPGRHAQLRADFDAHAADLGMHARLTPTTPTTPIKRPRGPRSR